MFAAALAALVAILAVAGVFSNGDDEQPAPATTAPVDEAAAPERPTNGGREQPRVSTVRVGGRPTAVSAGPDGVWVADSFSPRATMLDSQDEDAKPISFRLEGPATDVVAADAGAWFALPEQQAVQRREADDSSGAGEVVELDSFPSAVAADDEAVYALSERAVERIDASGGEVTDTFDVGGFASGVAVDGGLLWVVVDNREVVRLDARSGETRGEPVELKEPFGIAAANDTAWVVGAAGEVSRIDSGSAGPTTRVTVRGALDVAVGDGVVWVTSSRRTVSALDADSLKPIGDPLRVGDEATGVSVGGEAVWVANGGDGTLSRIVP